MVVNNRCTSENSAQCSFQMESMENTSFSRDVERGASDTSPVRGGLHNTNGSGRSGKVHVCRPEGCRIFHVTYMQDRRTLTSTPWDRLKTVFLLAIVSFVVVWVVLYVLLSAIGYL